MKPNAQEDMTELQEALRIMHSVVNTINNETQKRDVTLMTNRFIERLEGDWVSPITFSENTMTLDLTVRLRRD
jgi:hypothetical protein